LEGRELNLYTDLAPVDVQNANPKFAFSKTVADIGLIVAKRGDLTEFTRLFELALPHPLATPAIATPSSIALLQGFVRGLTQSVPPPFEEPQPASLAALLESSSTPIQALAIKIQAKLVFGTAAVVQDGAYVAAIERGEAVYQVTCAACHQPNGLGIEGLAPPLADPYWLSKSDEELSRIVIEGISGKIEVGGKTWDLVMPPWAQLSDDQVADVLTYVLAQFGDGKQERRTVSPVTVHSQRP
jgi:mono/diheme cytochrome c family protein